MYREKVIGNALYYIYTYINYNIIILYYLESKKKKILLRQFKFIYENSTKLSYKHHKLLYNVRGYNMKRNFLLCYMKCFTVYVVHIAIGL